MVYFQVREILSPEDMAEKSFERDNDKLGNSKVDLSKCVGFNIDYNHYYKFEVGLGKHDHDTEQAQFKVYVHKYIDDSDVTHYQLYLLQLVSGRLKLGPSLSSRMSLAH